MALNRTSVQYFSSVPTKNCIFFFPPFSLKRVRKENFYHLTLRFLINCINPGIIESAHSVLCYETQNLTTLEKKQNGIFQWWIFCWNLLLASVMFWSKLTSTERSTKSITCTFWTLLVPQNTNKKNSISCLEILLWGRYLLINVSFYKETDFLNENVMLRSSDSVSGQMSKLKLILKIDGVVGWPWLASRLLAHSISSAGQGEKIQWKNITDWDKEREIIHQLLSQSKQALLS